MLDTITERLSQYWETFANAPIEFQIIGGGLVLVAFYAISGATSKVWKALKPVRWVGAKGLNGLSWLLHRSKPKVNIVESEVCLDVPEVEVFDTSTKEAFVATCDYYRKSDRVRALTDEQLGHLNILIDHFGFTSYIDYGTVVNKPYRFLREEKERRLKANELAKINEKFYKREVEEVAELDKLRKELDELKKEAGKTTNPFHPYLEGASNLTPWTLPQSPRPLDRPYEYWDGGYTSTWTSNTVTTNPDSEYSNSWTTNLKTDSTDQVYSGTFTPDENEGALGSDLKLGQKVYGCLGVPYWISSIKKDSDGNIEYTVKDDQGNEFPNCTRIDLLTEDPTKGKPKFKVGEVVDHRDAVDTKYGAKYRILKSKKTKSGSWVYDVEFLDSDLKPKTAFYDQSEVYFKKAT